jgi:hypothetical protein
VCRSYQCVSITFKNNATTAHVAAESNRIAAESAEASARITAESTRIAAESAERSARIAAENDKQKRDHDMQMAQFYATTAPRV